VEKKEPPRPHQAVNADARVVVKGRRRSAKKSGRGGTRGAREREDDSALISLRLEKSQAPRKRDGRRAISLQKGLPYAQAVPQHSKRGKDG